MDIRLDPSGSLNETTLKGLFASLPMGVIVFGLDGRIIVANASALEILGLSHDETTGQTMMDPDWQVVREDGSPFPWEQYPAMIALREGVAVKATVMGLLRLSQGVQRWLRVNANPLWDEGERVGAYACFEDITERKQLEDRLELALLGANLGTYDANLQTGAVEVNERYLALLGYMPGELQMTTTEWMARIHPDDLPRVNAHYEHLIRTAAKFVEIEYRLRHKAGHWVWLQDRGRIFETDAAGHPVRIAGVQMDITASKQAEALLRRHRGEMEQVLAFQVAHQTVAGIAHELNQPLNAVTTLVEAAQRQLKDINPVPPRLVETLQDISKGAQRAGRVVNELMGFMRKPEIVQGAVDLGMLVLEVVAQCESSLQFEGEIKLRFPSVLPRVRGNTLQIETILSNLLRNAVEACRSNHGADSVCRIAIEGSVAGERVRIEVSDNGPGVPRELTQELFRSLHSGKPGGIGMGLAISHALAKSLGGSLEYDPAPEGGASFCLELPVMKEDSGQKHT